VYFPEGRWYDFWTDQYYDGPTEVHLEAPLELLPLFVQAGTILPLGPVVQHTDEPYHSLELHLFPGNGVSYLYEDDGKSWDYTRGVFRRTRFAVAATEHTLRLETHTEGAYASPITSWELYWHGCANPVALQVDGQQLAGLYDATRHLLTASLPTGFRQVHSKM
jgi:alpha-glucosidase